MLLTIGVLMNHLVHCVPEILAVEWHAHDKKTHAEHWLSLGEFDLAFSEPFGARILVTSP